MWSARYALCKNTETLWDYDLETMVIVLNNRKIRTIWTLAKNIWFFTKKQKKRFHLFLPSGQNCQKKQSEVKCVFVNSVLKIQCHIDKNTLHTAFSAILPTGSVVRHAEISTYLVCTFWCDRAMFDTWAHDNTLYHSAAEGCCICDFSWRTLLRSSASIEKRNPRFFFIRTSKLDDAFGCSQLFQFEGLKCS